MTLIIAGDLVPTQPNFSYFESGNLESIMGKELLSVWRESDIRIFNLEVPLTDEKEPIKKTGPNLAAPTKTAKGIKALNPSLVSLANNHILDQGTKGLLSTCETLSKLGIPFVGAGENQFHAVKPYVIDSDGKRIGVYSCAEHEFSIATEERPGANPFDPLESLDHISGLKNRCDYVVILYHGGKEHYRYPSPHLQKVCRRMVDKGADLVITQHSHCVGCYEQYSGSTIVYGQGNFIFDYSESDYWKTSLFVRVRFCDQIEVQYIPFFKNSRNVHLAKGDMMQEILTGFERRSKEIITPGFIEQEYRRLAERVCPEYLNAFLCRGRFLSALDKKIFRGFISKRIVRGKRLLMAKNIINCETHRELLLKGLDLIEKHE